MLAIQQPQWDVEGGEKFRQQPPTTPYGDQRTKNVKTQAVGCWPQIAWRRKWQPTPVFLPGESQGRGSLVGCCLWGHRKSDTTEVT